MFAESSNRTKGGRALSTLYGSSRHTGVERRRLDRFAHKAAAKAARQLPRLVKPEPAPELRVITLDQFLASRPELDPQQVELLPRRDFDKRAVVGEAL